MNKFDLQKNQALKLAGQLKQAATPDRFGAASQAPDRREQRKLDQAAEETRQRTEQAMLVTYENEDDLRRVFTERTGILDNNVQTASYNVASLRDALVTLLSSAGDRELAGQPVLPKQTEDIRLRHTELVAQQRLQASFIAQRLALDTEIEETLQRYRVLKGTAVANDPRG